MTKTKKREGEKKERWRGEREEGIEGRGLHQLFERGMHKRSHSSLRCCGLPYVQLSLSLFSSFPLCKIDNITQHTSGATDRTQTYATN